MFLLNCLLRDCIFGLSGPLVSQMVGGAMAPWPPRFLRLCLFHTSGDHVSVLRCSYNNLIEPVDKTRELNEPEYTEFVKFAPFLSPPSRYTKYPQSSYTSDDSAKGSGRSGVVCH